MSIRRVAILLFDDVEVLDFAGPFEVFSVTGRRQNLQPFDVYTVAERPGAVIARNGLTILPKHTLANAPQPHILVVPGGYGTRREMHNGVLVEWIRERAANAELVLSVCTGALLLAKAGLLDGLGATTHFGALGLLRETAPQTSVHGDRRFVDNGRIITSAGVAAGIDACFHVVARLLGVGAAKETAQYIEYPWQP